MQRIAFKMKLRSGCKAEYRKRHDEIWEDLKVLLKSKGISDYAIFLHGDSGDLFATLKIEDGAKLNELSSEPLMKKWWNYMKDVMETSADNSPVSTTMDEVFYLP